MNLKEQDLPELEFESKSIDLGEIKINSETKGKYIFTNNGKVPLIIKEVKPHCGCTVASYTETPILPKKQGYINFVYTAPSTPQQIKKIIVVSANTREKSYLLKIVAKVKK